MPGPAPKSAQTRQRRNKTTTQARMQAVGRRRQRAPRLPKDTDWHTLTRAWWHEVWASPMADQFLEVDIQGLFMLAELIDQFWTEPSTALAAEIRLQRQCFGLTPIDRRRLQWEVERVEQVVERRRKRKVGATEPVADPRSVMRAVK